MHARLLKFLAVFSLGMITFPFMLTNDVLAFENIDPLRIAAYYAAFAVIFAFGYAMSFVGRRGKLRRLLCRAAGGCVFFAALALLPFTESIALIGAAGFSAVFWYFVGERAARKNYADLFPMYMFGIYIALTLLSYIFYGGLAPDELREPVRNAVVIAFSAEICLTALLVNQSGIYDKANRRRETRSMLPKGLSGYNAALVLIITLAGLGLYVFNDKIVWLLQETVRLLARLMLWLMRFNTESMEIVQPETEEMPLIEQQELGGWAPVVYIIAIIMAVVFRRQIWSAIKNTVLAIYRFFIRETPKSSEEPDFVDVLEQTSRPRRSKSDGLSDSALRRRYRAETSPQKKFRLGYRILLRGMIRGRAGITPSDTCAQQCAKGRQVYGERLDSIARCYDAVRYNGETPTAAQLGEIDGLINN